MLFILKIVWILFYHNLLYFLWHNNPQRKIKYMLLDLAKHNVLFIKLFQSLSSYTELLGEQYTRELIGYTNYAYYTDNDIDYNVLDIISNKYNITIDTLKPVNSGMIAIVYTGVDNITHNRVIIKLKRIGINTRLQQAVNQLKYIYNIMTYLIPANKYVKLLRPFIMNIDDILLQCNFNSEINNLIAAKKDSSDFPEIIIPTCYQLPEDKHDNIQYIVMEYLHGKTLCELINSDDKQYINHYAAYLCKYMYIVFLNGFIVNSDLHGGNIIYMKSRDNKLSIGIIDFGMAVKPDYQLTNVITSFVHMSHESYKFNQLQLIDKKSWFMRYTDLIGDFKYMFNPTLDVVYNLPHTRVLQLKQLLYEFIVLNIIDKVEIKEDVLFSYIDKLSSTLDTYIEFNKQFYSVIITFTMINGVIDTLMNYTVPKLSRPDLSKKVIISLLLE